MSDARGASCGRGPHALAADRPYLAGDVDRAAAARAALRDAARALPD